MRKWTYLVAALLMSGTAATFTSCIDTDEPAGIEALRGAKAELLSAKAQVELAEADFKRAQIAIEEAKAAYLQEKVKQEQFETAIKEASAAKDIAYWQQEAAKSLEEYNARMYQLKQATAQAQLEYERAMEKITLALATVKEDAYANELFDLLTVSAFSFDYTPYTYDETTGQVTAGTKVTKSISGGLRGLSAQLTQLNEELADLNRAKAMLEFSYDPAALELAVSNTVSVKEGEVKAAEEILADLKSVAGTPLEEIENKYKDIKDKLATIDEQIAQLEITKANDEAYQAAILKQQEVTAAKTAKGEFTFEIPVEIQNSFKGMVENLIAINTPSTGGSTPTPAIVTNLTKLNEFAKQNADNEYGYPNGFNLSLTLGDQIALLDELIKAMEGEYSELTPSTNEIEKKVLSDQELAVAKDNLTGKEIEKNALSDQRKAAEETWVTKKTAYDKEYADGDYASDTQNSRAKIIALYNKFASDYAAETDATKKDDLLVAFIAEYKKYVEKRTLIDGLSLDASINIIADKTKYTDWENATNTDKETTFGVEDLEDATKGAAGELWDAAKTLGYAKTRLTLVTYDEWKENSSNPSSIGVISTGLTDNAYKAEKDYNDQADVVANAGIWTTLNETLTTTKAIKDESMAALDAKEVEAESEVARLGEKYAEESSKLSVQKEGLNKIVTALETAVTSDPDKQSGVTATYDDVIANFKNQIAFYEGGTVTINTIPGSTTGGVTTPTSTTITYTKGALAELKEDLQMYQKLLEAIKAGTFEEEEETAINTITAQINSKTDERDAIQILFNIATERKNQLLKALTGESSSTPAE